MLPPTGAVWELPSTLKVPTRNVVSSARPRRSQARDRLSFLASLTLCGGTSVTISVGSSVGVVAASVPPSAAMGAAAASLAWAPTSAARSPSPPSPSEPIQPAAPPTKSVTNATTRTAVAATLSWPRRRDRGIACLDTEPSQVPAAATRAGHRTTKSCLHRVPRKRGPHPILDGSAHGSVPSSRARPPVAWPVSTAPTRVYAARLVGLPIFDPQGDQVGKVRDLVVAVRSEASQPRVLGHGRRGVRPAPDLRADDPGDQHRQRAGLHDRAAQHAPLRAALRPRPW